MKNNDGMTMAYQSGGIINVASKETITTTYWLACYACIRKSQRP